MVTSTRHPGVVQEKSTGPSLLKLEVTEGKARGDQGAFGCLNQRPLLVKGCCLTGVVTTYSQTSFM
jgi:hypothetical protein